MARSIKVVAIVIASATAAIATSAVAAHAGTPAKSTIPSALVGEWCPVSRPRCRLWEGLLVGPTTITTWQDGTIGSDEGPDPTTCKVKRIRERRQLDLMCNGEGVDPDL
jgi:hypothetical protein